jgi:hypothetical protein
MNRILGGWGKHVLLKSTLKPEMIALGRVIGDIDIRCNLVLNRSKWHTPPGPLTSPLPDYPLRGLLYFEFQFCDHGKASLMSATISITLKDPGGKYPVYVDKTYPGPEALKPMDAPMQERTRTRELRVDPNVQTPFGGGGLASVSGGSQTKSPVEQTWSFKSGTPTTTGNNSAEFEWKRNSPSDWTGVDRGYDGALTLRREKHEDIVLVAMVKITAKNNPNLSRKKTVMHKIGREYGTRFDKDDFDDWEKHLPADVRDRNRKRVDPRMLRPRYHY